MKQLIIIISVLSFFILGFIIGKDLQERRNILNEKTYELVNLQYETLYNADLIMWHNNLFDADGSDEMANYLELKTKVDSTYSTLYK